MLANTSNTDAELSPEEQTAFEQLQKITDQRTYTYQKAIAELAEHGMRYGFKINIADEIKEIGGEPKEYNPLSQKEEWAPKTTLWKQRQFWYTGNITTKEYNEFAVFRGRWQKEKSTGDPEKAEDMETRMYEYIVIKFLGMNHSTYERAKKDEVRMAADACLYLSSWNSEIGVQPEPIRKTFGLKKQVNMPPLTEFDKAALGEPVNMSDQDIVENTKKSRYYSSPDEQ